MEQPDHEWLKTPEGRAWLESDEGGAWFHSPEGYDWSRSKDAEAWYDELAQRGFERFFSGEMPAPAHWMIAPEDSPRIGARVRLTSGAQTLSGKSFSAGDLMIVSEIHLMPLGAVRLVLRSIDGRTLISMSGTDFEPA